MSIDFDKELNKYGLDRDTYEKVLIDRDKKMAGASDDDWSEIIERYGVKCANDTFRKASQTIFGGYFVNKYFKSKEAENTTDDDYLNQLRLEKQEIQKEKRKLFDERLDLNKRLREEARMETTIEKIENMLSEISDKRYIQYSPIVNESDNDIVVMLSDLHIGAEFYGFTGYYNSEIAKQRLEDYLSEIIEIQKMHESKNCYVVLLGDAISGSIHKTISITNKENVIEQVKLACEYISDFVYELGKHFNFVEFHNVSGNHSRIDKKDDALLDERLDSLIPWFMKSMLKECSNINIVEEELDSTLASFFVRDRLYFGIHGDFDNMTDSSIAKLALWAKMTPYCVLTGHKHHSAMTEVNGIKVIQSGSLGGSGDDFTRQKRLGGSPSQTVLVVNDKGIKSIYPIEFN